MIVLQLIVLVVLPFYLGYRLGRGVYVCKKCGQKRRAK